MAMQAEIVQGIVANVIIATAKDVENIAGTWVEISEISPQPAIGWKYDNGAFSAPSAQGLTPQELLSQKLLSGCHITSSSKPNLNGTYDVSPAMQQRVQAIVSGINSGKGFPHGNKTYNWPIMESSSVTFSDPADFLNMAAALEAYVSDLMQTEAALLTGNSATWPSQSVTIS